MIVIKLMGGLGNQMFQYAAARGLAEHHNTKVGLDLSWFKEVLADEKTTTRQYELELYKIKARLVNRDGLQLYRQGSLKKYLPSGKSKFLFVEEHGHAYNKFFKNLPDNSYLLGWLQSEKYFIDIADKIREELTPKQPLDKVNAGLIKQIQLKPSVSLHVRRGDYAADVKTKAFHGLLPLSYYQKAIEIIQKKVPQANLFVFSDDIAWIRQNLKSTWPATYVSHNTGRDSYKDIVLMSHCQHNIIANSSFSWWGAWLNDHPDKIVIAPKNYFKDKQEDVSDQIPESWIKL